MAEEHAIATTKEDSSAHETEKGSPSHIGHTSVEMEKEHINRDTNSAN